MNLENYFNELDPKVRLEILENINDENINFIREVYNKRYSKNDKWLWCCMTLKILYGQGGFFKKSRNKEILKITNELLMNDTETSHKNILYNEYRNVAKVYLSTCKDSNYAASMLGLHKADDDTKIFRACQDIYEMSKGIAKSSGLLEKMNLWCEAFYDELIEYSPICKAEYQRLDK